MSATIYRDANFAGEFQRLGPGVHYGRGLVGQRWGGSTGAELANEISSVRVDRNTIVTLHDSQAGGVGSGANGSRVLTGPTEVADLATIGLDNRVSRVEVHPYLETTTWGAGPVDYGAGAILFSAYGLQGRQTLLPEGDHDAARLASDEHNFAPGSARSLAVSPGYIAILYTDGNIGAGDPAAVVPGPARVDDLQRLGLLGSGGGGSGNVVRSVRVVRTAGSGPPVAGAFVPSRVPGYSTRFATSEPTRRGGGSLALLLGGDDDAGAPTMLQLPHRPNGRQSRLPYFSAPPLRSSAPPPLSSAPPPLSSSPPVHGSAAPSLGSAPAPTAADTSSRWAYYAAIFLLLVVFVLSIALVASVKTKNTKLDFDAAAANAPARPG